MKFRNLRLEIDSGGVAELTLERPEVLNALNEETIRELDDAFRSLERDEKVRIVLLSGAGKAFSAGADIPEVRRLDAETSQAFSRRGHAVLNRIERGPKPVLAAVRGFCLGGGCELALACHIRIAGSDARIGLPEVRLGIIPGYGGTQRLARIVGRSKALELLLCGRTMTAQEALAAGLVVRVVEPDDLLPTCRELASRIAGQAPLAVRYCFEAVNRGYDLPLQAGLDLETALFGLASGTDDMKEGTRAFMEKRRPRFKGR
ncbi:MAG: enoyl-CoA hydratase-related protein [Candidatus Aminicenantes bacterium]|nr:enoyl-CoA hydratase-related protein [Candidatus Aminicenantes bacterium]